MYLQKGLIWIFPISESNQCSTPDRRRGNCIDLRQCATLYNLIRKPNLSILERNYLRESQCAYYGYPWV